LNVEEVKSSLCRYPSCLLQYGEGRLHLTCIAVVVVVERWVVDGRGALLQRLENWLIWVGTMVS
jgi:hypothetical protein